LILSYKEKPQEIFQVSIKIKKRIQLPPFSS